MTSRRRVPFRCVKCGNTIMQPIDERHPKFAIRSPCCGVELVQPVKYEAAARAYRHDARAPTAQSKG